MDRPLTALFIDCDSFFASVEQHLDPRLRGKPVGVAPVMAESSCCIAASYEAKAHGVKTGTRISDARIMCPGIAIVESKPAEYIKIHHRIDTTIDKLQARYGRSFVYFGNVHDNRESAPMRISFTHVPGERVDG